VRWRLVPRLGRRVAALVPVASVEAAAGLLGDLRTRVPSLEAVEFFTDEGMRLVLDHLGEGPPVEERVPVYVLVECASLEELAEVLPDDALVADDTTSRERLWRIRESHTEAINAAGVPHKLDVGVPLEQLGSFLERVPEVVRDLDPSARTMLFGHLGDGNVHVNVLDLEPGDDAVDEAVLRVAAACDGTISAEHGVGILKARWLELVRSPGELRAMAQIKRALDPDGLLNPGVMLP
jgi:FAD/FMN-containing dehydrogenase